MKYLRKYTLVLFVLLAAVISPAGIKVAYALSFGEILINLAGGAGEVTAYIVAQVINFLIYIPSAWILRAAAFVFDEVVPYSLGIAAPGHSAFQSAFITEGWGLMRDMTNMLFIFAMLYIAIATILQLGAGRNTKALIINIILIALFVNFSLFLAQVVIDGANLLAIEFYRALAGGSNGHGLAAIFITGFNPQQLLGTASFDYWISVRNQSNTVLIVIYLFGGIVQLIAAYMIFWASFLFIGRIVILWILMILSPLAFAAYIIPKTQHWFHKWWERLLNQAFVAPIFLFFFFIFALFIQGGLGTFLDETARQASGGDRVIDAILKVTLGFSLVVAFMFVALKTTKMYAAEAGEWATKAVGFTVGAASAAVTGPAGAARLAGLAKTFGVPTAGMAAGGAVGRVAGVPLAPIREKIYGKGREVGGGAAKKVVEAGRKPGLGGALLRGFGIAGVAGGLEAAAKAGAKTDIEKTKKDFGGLSEGALLTKYGLATTSAEVRAGIIELLGAKKKLGRDKEGKWRIDPKDIKKTLATVKERGYDTEKEIEDKYLWQYAQEPDEIKKAAKTLSPDAFKEIGKMKIEKTNADGTKEELPSDFFDATTNPDGTKNTEVFDIAVKNMTSAHFKMLLDPEVRSDFSESFVKNLKDAMAREKASWVEKLKKTGKNKDAADIESGERGLFIEEYFQSIQNARGGSAIKEPSLRGFFADNDVLYKKKTKDEDEGEGGGGGAKGKKEKTDEEEKADRAKFYQDFFGAGKKEPET